MLASVHTVGAQQNAEPVSARLAGLNFDVGLTFDDNVTRSMGPGQKLADQSLNLNASKSEIVRQSDNTRMIILGFLGAERFRTYFGLSRVFGGVQGQFQYRPSAEFDAPIYELVARASVDNYESSLRSGVRYTLGASVRKPLTDRIEVSAALAHNQRRADSQVFTTRDTSGRVNVDYAIGGKATAYLTGEYRRGDTVSTGLATLANLDIAKSIARDDAYHDAARFAYRVDARTFLSTLGFNYALDEKKAFDFSWRRAKSTPFAQPDYIGAEHVSYVVNQFNVTYLFRY